jgi:hypothetical protein
VRVRAQNKHLTFSHYYWPCKRKKNSPWRPLLFSPRFSVTQTCPTAALPAPLHQAKHNDLQKESTPSRNCTVMDAVPDMSQCTRPICLRPSQAPGTRSFIPSLRTYLLNTSQKHIHPKHSRSEPPPNRCIRHTSFYSIMTFSTNYRLSL